jgi:hypothetical protein
MICSVYDPHRRCYDYFEVPGTAKDYGARGQKYRYPTQAPQGNQTVGLIGFAPEALAMPLPSAAQPVGSGDVARGVICVVGRQQGLGGMPGNLTLQTLTGLGSDAPTAPQVVSNIERQAEATKHWGQVIGTAVVAGVVGVVVQQLLQPKKRKSR